MRDILRLRCSGETVSIRWPVLGGGQAALGERLRCLIIAPGRPWSRTRRVDCAADSRDARHLEVKFRKPALRALVTAKEAETVHLVISLTDAQVANLINLGILIINLGVLIVTAISVFRPRS
jgi:hypothetical protein